MTFEIFTFFLWPSIQSKNFSNLITNSFHVVKIKKILNTLTYFYVVMLLMFFLCIESFNKRIIFLLLLYLDRGTQNKRSFMIMFETSNIKEKIEILVHKKYYKIKTMLNVDCNILGKKSLR